MVRLHLDVNVYMKLVLSIRFMLAYPTLTTVIVGSFLTITYFTGLLILLLWIDKLIFSESDSNYSKYICSNNYSRSLFSGRRFACADRIMVIEPN